MEYEKNTKQIFILAWTALLHMLQFANGTALISYNNTLVKTVDGLQQLLDKAVVRFNTRRLKIKPDK